MFQGDSPQGRVQALRSVDKSIPPNAVPLASPDEIYHVETHPDPETQKEIVLWDDILQAFKNAELVRYKTRVIPFLKGKNFTVLQPRRIAAVPNTVLDVIIDTSTIGMKDTPSGATSAVRRNPHDHDEAAMDNYSHIDKPLLIQDTPSDATSAVRRSPHDHEEAAMDNYSHIEMPLAFPSARGPQAVLDDQARLAQDLSVRPHQDNGTQLRGPQNPTSAAKKDLAQLGISASKGDKVAQIALGDMYRDGNGVPRDDQAALDWYLQAAEQGDPIGQIRLGELYQYGQGVPQDYEQSLNWYLLAANRGSIRAQREIADFYYNGRGVPKDYAKAMVWYRKAADQGDAGSQCKVGSLYEYGSGVGYDHLKAAEWYQKAADQGHAFAKKCLRALKDKGMPDI